MKNVLFGILLGGLIFFVGCNSKPNAETNTSKNVEYYQSPELAETDMPVGFVLTGLTYSVGPQFDSTSCIAYGECDCCMSDYAFLTDTTFVAVDYCLEGNGYYNGTYRIESNRIVFKLNGNCVSKDFPELGVEADSLPPFTLSIKEIEQKQFTWRGVKCRATLCFRNDVNEYASMDTTTATQFINTLKADSIWQLLEGED